MHYKNILIYFNHNRSLFKHISNNFQKRLKQLNCIIVIVKAGNDYAHPKENIKDSKDSNKVSGVQSTFLVDLMIPIDNNFAERTVKSFVVVRKNWMFSTSVKGVQSSAMTYSIINTAATSYSVYYSISSNSNFTRLITLTGTSYLNTKLASGKTYYFKVSANKNIGNTTTVVSAFSNVKSVKVK